MADYTPTARIPGLTPFICTYYQNGIPLGITLHGSDEKQVVADNISQLPGLKVEGVGLYELEIDDQELDHIRSRYVTDG